MAKIAVGRPLYGLWQPKCWHIASPQAPGLVHSRGRFIKGYWWSCNALPSLSCLFTPKPLPSAPVQAHTTGAAWCLGLRLCKDGPPLLPRSQFTQLGPYQVILTLWHLSVCLHPPTVSERSGLLLAKNGQNRALETTIWAVAAKISGYSLSPGIVHSCGRCTKG